MSYIQNKLDEFDKIVDGIDKDEVEYDFGWWETPTGADFGKSKKDELSIFIKQAITDYHNHIVEKVKEQTTVSITPETKLTEIESYQMGANSMKQQILQIISLLQDTNK